MQIKLNHRTAIEYYCLRAGGRGRKLLEEYKLTHAEAPDVRPETNDGDAVVETVDLSSMTISSDEQSSDTTKVVA